MRRFDVPAVGYTTPVTPAKGVAGIGLLKHRCDASRSFFAESAALLSVPPVLAARAGSLRARRFAQAVSGRPTRSSRRPRLVSGAVVVANHTAWRPIMADQSQAACQHTIPEVLKLRNAVEFMDCLSQGALSGIATIAKLALCRLESPDGYRCLDDIAHALEAIWEKATEVRDCINSEAEQVGCEYVNVAQRRRWSAQAAHREAISQPHQE